MEETGTSFAHPLQVSYSRVQYTAFPGRDTGSNPVACLHLHNQIHSHVRCNRLHIGLPNRRNGIVPRYVLMVYSFIGKDIRLSAGRAEFNSQVNRFFLFYFNLAERSVRVREVVGSNPVIPSALSSTVLGNRLIRDDTGFDSLGAYQAELAQIGSASVS